MLKARHKHLHPLLKIAEWLLISAASTTLLFAVWYLLPLNRASVGSLLLLQALQAIALFIVPPFIVAYLWSEQPLQWLHLKQPSALSNQQSDWSLALLSIGIVLTAVPLINCLVSWNQSITLPESLSALEQTMRQMEEQADQILQHFLTYHNGAWWVLLLNIIILAILPAIGEELTFRGVLQNLLSPFNSHISIWLTAFIFSFVHFQFYGFIPRFILGAILGYALLWSGRIRFSMLMHATNNALSVLIFYLGTYVWHISSSELDALGTNHTWWLTALCTPLMLILLYLFYRRTHNPA